MINKLSVIVSALFHLSLIALIIGLSAFNPEDEFIEIGFGEPGGGSGGASSTMVFSGADIPNLNDPGKTDIITDKAVEDIPKQKTDINPDKEKIKTDNSNIEKKELASTKKSEDESGENSVSGRGGQGTNPNGTGIGNGWGTGSGTGNGNGNGVGDGIGDGISINFGGRVRKIYNYLIPPYPNGVSKQIDVRLRFSILPDGTVGSIIVLTKVDGRLENAAINSLKLWRFEPIPSGQTQVEQKATIVFPFRLK